LDELLSYQRYTLHCEDELMNSAAVDCSDNGFVFQRAYWTSRLHWLPPVPLVVIKFKYLAGDMSGTYLRLIHRPTSNFLNFRYIILTSSEWPVS